MAECMLNLLSNKGTIIIEVQYLMNTLKDLTLIIFIMNINYWSLTSLVYFFNQFNVKYLDLKKLTLMRINKDLYKKR